MAVQRTRVAPQLAVSQPTPEVGVPAVPTRARVAPGRKAVLGRGLVPRRALSSASAPWPPRTS
eukprot:3749965-Alexandrium_andersonii.AAC.1